MKKEEYQPFAKLILAAAEAVDRKLSPERIGIYFEDLFDLDIRAIQYAVREHRKISPYFPKVSEIREHARLWKAPRPYGIQGEDRKMIETGEAQVFRREEAAARFREISERLGNLDLTFGSNLLKASGVDESARRRVLEEQAEEIKRGAA